MSYPGEGFVTGWQCTGFEGFLKAVLCRCYSFRRGFVGEMIPYINSAVVNFMGIL